MINDDLVQSSVLTNNAEVRNLTLVRSKQLSKMLNVSEASLIRWEQDKNNPFPLAVRLSGRLKFWRLNDISNWLDNLEKNQGEK